MNTTPEPPQAAIPTDTLLESDTRGGRLVYKPYIRPNGAAVYEIRGQREDKSIVAWGFWGGLLVAVVAVLLLMSAQSVYSVWDLLWALIALSFGVFLYRYGKRSSLREDVLCVVDTSRQTLSWPTPPRAGELVVSFDEVTEIVFGMTDFPLSDAVRDVQVHAFTLLVRDARERLIPVVEATPHKEEAHTIAKILGNELEMRITYVGKGIK